LYIHVVLPLQLSQCGFFLIETFFHNELFLLYEAETGFHRKHIVIAQL